MRPIKIMGLCFAAVFVFGVLVASAAQAAEPEWGHCVTQKHGNYTEGNCRTVAVKNGIPDHKGKYEWIGGAEPTCYAHKKGKYADPACTTPDEHNGKPKGKYEKTGNTNFTSNGGSISIHLEACTNPEEKPLCEAGVHEEINIGDPELVYVMKNEIRCENETGSGEASGTKEVRDVKLTLHGCYATRGGSKNSESECYSSDPGAGSAEIQTEELKGELGYLDRSAHEVGLVLHPATGTVFAKFYCPDFVGKDGLMVAPWTLGEGSATPGTFYAGGGGDGIISPVTPVNEMTTTLTQEYVTERYTTPHTEEEYKNTPGRFEGGPLEELEDQAEGEFYEPRNITYGGPREFTNTEWGPVGVAMYEESTSEKPEEIKG